MQHNAHLTSFEVSFIQFEMLDFFKANFKAKFHDGESNMNWNQNIYVLS